MRHAGRIPPPDFWIGQHPAWWTETIEANERAAVTRRPASKTKDSNEPR
jgi:hypothetical protein